MVIKKIIFFMFFEVILLYYRLIFKIVIIILCKYKIIGFMRGCLWKFFFFLVYNSVELIKNFLEVRFFFVIF